jgi:hypothetical protein
VLNGIGLKKIIKKLERYTGQNSGGTILVDATESGLLKKLTDSSALSDLVAGVQTSLAITNELRVWQGPGYNALSHQAKSSSSNAISYTENSSPDESFPHEHHQSVSDVHEEHYPNAGGRFNFILGRNQSTFHEIVLKGRRLYVVFQLVGAFLALLCWTLFICEPNVSTPSLSILPFVAGIVRLDLISNNQPNYDEIWSILVGYLFGFIGVMCFFAREIGTWTTLNSFGNDSQSISWWISTIGCGCMGMSVGIFSLAASSSNDSRWISACAIISGIGISGMSHFTPLVYAFITLATLWGSGFMILFLFCVFSETFRRNSGWGWYDTPRIRDPEIAFLGRLCFMSVFMFCIGSGPVSTLAFCVVPIILLWIGKSDIVINLSAACFGADVLAGLLATVFRFR